MRQKTCLNLSAVSELSKIQFILKFIIRTLEHWKLKMVIVARVYFKIFNFYFQINFSAKLVNKNTVAQNMVFYWIFLFNRSTFIKLQIQFFIQGKK